MIPALIAALIISAPCETGVLVATGQTVMCDGALVPADDIRKAREFEAAAGACAIRLGAEQRACGITAAAADRENARLEQMLDARDGFDWGAFMTGAGAGVVLAGVLAIVVYGVTK